MPIFDEFAKFLKSISDAAKEGSKAPGTGASDFVKGANVPKTALTLPIPDPFKMGQHTAPTPEEKTAGAVSAATTPRFDPKSKNMGTRDHPEGTTVTFMPETTMQREVAPAKQMRRAEEPEGIKQEVFKNPWGGEDYLSSPENHIKNVRAHLGQMTRDMTAFNKRYGPDEPHANRARIREVRKELFDLEKKYPPQKPKALGADVTRPQKSPVKLWTDELDQKLVDWVLGDGPKRGERTPPGMEDRTPLAITRRLVFLEFQHPEITEARVARAKQGKLPQTPTDKTKKGDKLAVGAAGAGGAAAAAGTPDQAQAGVQNPLPTDQQNIEDTGRGIKRELELDGRGLDKSWMRLTPEQRRQQQNAPEAPVPKFGNQVSQLEPGQAVLTDASGQQRQLQGSDSTTGQGGSAPQRIDIGDGRIVEFPADMPREQIQKALVDYWAKKNAPQADQEVPAEPRASGLAGVGQTLVKGAQRTGELFSEGVSQIRRGGEQLSGEAPLERPPEILDEAAAVISEGLGSPRDQGPPTQEQQEASERGYQKAVGAGNIAGGLYSLLQSPWGFVSEGLEHYGGKENFPKEVTEAVLGLTTPAAAIKAGKYLAWGTLPQTAKNGITNAIAKLPVPIQETITGKMHPDRELARELVRQRGGTAARETATTMQSLEEFRRMVNRMPDPGRIELYKYIEGRSRGVPIANPAHQQLADTLRTEFAKRKTELQNLPSTQQMTFVEDYFTHMWADPRATAQFMRKWNQTAKQGTGANLKKRTIPTIADGLAAGLKLKTTDPIEATMAYVANMDRYLASNHIMREGQGLGMIKFYNVGDRRIPVDWRELKGRLSTKGTPVPGNVQKAYAPREFAAIYNHFIDQGVYAYERPGQIYEAALKTSNAVTALELGLSGFHAVTMANEAMISAYATGVRQVVQGAKNLSPLQVMGGVKDIVKGAAAPVITAIRGRQVQRAYLGVTQASGHMKKIVDLLEHAGGRAAGFEHAPDYKFSAAGSYWTSIKRAALRAELKADFAEAKARPIVGSGKVVLRHVGRILRTAAQPLFEQYVPKLKNGAFYDAMSGWLRTHPGSSQLEQLREARRIWDSIDNRFGEMVQDNIFWWKYAKQGSMLTMRSYSWNMGTFREIAGGAADTARAVTKKGDFSSRAAYIIGLTMQVALVNAVYQYLRTGKLPETVDDLLAGQTGGEAPGVRVPSLPRGPGMPNIRTSSQATVPERVLVPGYQKDVFGWYEDWLQELSNKKAGAITMAADLLSNRDWKNDPIFNPENSAPGWLKEFFTYLVGHTKPISVKQLEEGPKTGSNIGYTERFLGLRPAPGYLQDPEGYAEAKHRRNLSAQRRKELLEQRRQQQYGGPLE